MKTDKKNERIREYAKKWQENTITPEEREKFNLWYNSFENKQTSQVDPEVSDGLGNRMLEEISKKIIISTKRKNSLRLVLYSAAASITILIGIVILAKQYPAPKVAPTETVTTSTNAMPGSNKATLTFENGQKIDLTTYRIGELKVNTKTRLTKTSEGKLVYAQLKHSDQNENSPLVHHTLSTPRSGMFQLTLSDGTKVWLNSASSIRYPEIFDHSQRIVYLKGEGYFEVMKDDRKPFIVVTPKQTVQVIGTHFNVSAYQDESITKTTLLEGKVRIVSVSSKESKSLLPNQQALLQQDNLQVIKVNADEAVGWKNGYFIFNHTDLRSLMRQFSRWYDVDIIYKGKVKNDLFQGQIPRNIKLNQALKILEFGDIHFKLEKGKLIIFP